MSIAPARPRRAPGRGAAALATLALCACTSTGATPPPVAAGDGTFASDLAFLQQHVDVVVLTSPTGARVALSPALQGRVLTSTAGGERAESLGWFDRAQVAARGSARAGASGGAVRGGEDRFWLAPEGGPFALFFAPGSEYTPEQWRPPAAIEREPWDVLARSSERIVVGRRFDVVSRAGTRLRIDARREVALCDPAEALTRLGATLPRGVRAVAFESVNTVENAGREPWRKETGVPAIRVLGAFPASPACDVLVPFVTGRERYHGPVLDDSGTAALPADRLRVDDERGLITVRADGRLGGRIGVSPRRAKPMLGSWDATRGVLTIVELSLPVDARDYPTSKWRRQDEPYAGDVVAVRPAGPVGFGDPAGDRQSASGGAYQVESGSPALALAPGGAATHVHRTLHLVGSPAALAPVARAVLGADLAALARQR
jgi:hypothetical protein